MLRVIFIGATRFGLRCLEEIERLSECKVIGVVTAPKQFRISCRLQGLTNVLHAVFNGERATAFRRHILSVQGKVSICRLCSGYGLPRLEHAKSAGFAIERHSLNRDDVPTHEEAIAQAPNRERGVVGE